RPPWLDKSYATQMALRHLAPQDSMTVVRSAQQYQAMPEPLEQMIITKAEGNPFFLEELTRAVLDRADVGTDVTVPDTIQDVLMARIDRLPEAPKRPLTDGRGAGTRNFATPVGGALGRSTALGTPTPRAHAPGIPLCARQCRGGHVCVQARSDPGGGL